MLDLYGGEEKMKKEIKEKMKNLIDFGILLFIPFYAIQVFFKVLPIYVDGIMTLVLVALIGGKMYVYGIDRVQVDERLLKNQAKSFKLTFWVTVLFLLGFWIVNGFDLFILSVDFVVPFLLITMIIVVSYSMFIFERFG